MNLIPPIKKIGGKIINTNADEILMQNYKKFDKIIIYTLKDRNKDKFKEINNIEIRYV